MKIDITNEQATIDAADLAKLLDMDPAEVQEKMRAGEITSVFETGAEEHAGKLRLTFFHEGKTVRLICATDGTVLQTLRSDSGVA